MCVEPGEAFGKILRGRRKERALSQEKLALDAGLERVYISMLERGQRQPTFQTMIKLATSLGCAPSELVADAEKLLSE